MLLRSRQPNEMVLSSDHHQKHPNHDCPTRIFTGSQSLRYCERVVVSLPFKLLVKNQPECIEGEQYSYFIEESEVNSVRNLQLRLYYSTVDRLEYVVIVL
jgi:hypothetical protein